MSFSDMSEKYLARFGSSGVSVLGLDEFIQILELVVTKNKGFFIFKIDVERDQDIYTFVLNMSASNGVVIRKDTDNIGEGMDFVFSELERSSIYP